MKARMASPAVKKVLGYRLTQQHRILVSNAANAFGAELILTSDCETRLCDIIEKGAEHEPGNDGSPERECLLISGFDRKELSAFVDMLRGSGAVIPLKAVYTEHNRGWSFRQLIAELEKEHAYMQSQNRGGSGQ